MNNAYQTALLSAAERLEAAEKTIAEALSLAQDAYDALSEAEQDGAAGEALLNEIANIEDADEMLADVQDALRSRAAK
mgnify:FL=1